MTMIVALFYLLIATPCTDAFTNDIFYGTPKTLGVLSVRDPSTAQTSAGMRGSFRCYCAAKNTKETKSKKTKSKKKASSAQPRPEDEYYWVNKTAVDNFQMTFQDVDVENEEESTLIRPSSLRFKICGNPRPLQRHRTSRFRTYNPSEKYQKVFQDAFHELVAGFDTQGFNYPFFEEDEYLAMTIIFRMKRPKSHFVNSRPGPGRLKAKSPPQLSTIRSDVDNLTKFVLDSMNGVIYEDDRQITSIHATKILDNEDLCAGSIEVHVRSIDVDDVETILASSIAIADPEGQ